MLELAEQKLKSAEEALKKFNFAIVAQESFHSDYLV
jgi:hypothetical protein